MGNGLFCCLSDVPGLLCCGCSYSQRMNRINENSLCWGRLVAFEFWNPVNTGNFKQSGRYWCDLLAHRCARTGMHCDMVRFFPLFFFASTWVQELLVLSSTTNTHLISHPDDWSFSCGLLWILTHRSQQRLIDAVYSQFLTHCFFITPPKSHDILVLLGTLWIADKTAQLG